MKKCYNIFIAALCAVILMACEKDEDRTVFLEGTSPILSVSESSVVLTEANAGAEVVSFSWTPSEFGYSAAVSYSLQIDSAGNNFTDPEIATGSGDREVALTVADLNSIVTKLGLLPDVADEVEVRVAAVISDQVEPVYSEVVNLTVTPYSTFIEPVYIYVPGAYQGWDPGSANALVSVEANNMYVGYVSFADPAGLMFKFTPEKSWDVAYGDGGEGKLSTSGGDLAVPEVGTYWMEVDLNELTWSATPGGWAVVGNSTPGGWDVDTDMNYNDAENVWEIELPLTAGLLKFRLDNTWDVNYGDNDTSDDLLNSGGADIPVTEAGTYVIVLNLTDEENPTYTLTKIE